MFTQRSFRFPIFLCIIILLASCNNNNSTAPVTTDSSRVPSADSMSSVNKINASPQPTNLIGNYLDTLWVDAAIFSNLPHRLLAFRFYVDNTESLLMNGWVVKLLGGYPPNPDVTLSTGRASTIQYLAGDYLGNLLLSGAEIQTIRQYIVSNNAKYVLFAPIDPATASFKGQITYSILVTSDDPHPLVKIVNPNVVNTNVKTNPSPPGTA